MGPPPRRNRGVARLTIAPRDASQDTTSPWKVGPMRHLITGSRVIALLACLSLAAGCGSAATVLPSGAPATSAATVPAGAAPAAVVPAVPAAAAPAAGAKRADLLNGVACAGRQCIAVGGYYDGTAASRTLVELWTGSAWRLEPSPDGPRYSALQAVSCDPAGCLAVGSPVIAGSGGRWRLVSLASPLNAVSCAVGSCLAVGGTSRAPRYASWDGRAWRAAAMHAPPPPAQSVTVAGVSCPSAPDCVAVGDYSSGATAQPGGSFRDKTLAEQWNGSTWRLLPTVNVGRVDQLTAVSCPSPGACTAVGTAAQQYPLAERWNGTAWRAEPVPAPGSVGYTKLTAVSCPSDAWCVAVGSYQGQPVAEVWNGRTWRLQRLPEPPADNDSAQLTGVSCARPTACLAVGVSGSGRSYAEQYNGVSWRLAATQNPA